jgi:hypothetical protein
MIGHATQSRHGTRMAAAVVLATLVAGGLAGCVKRTISITSEPNGALVHLNDQEVGRTPLTVPFRFYGTYDVRLEKDGYEPLWTEADAAAPWWETPGPDLVAEMIPGAASEIRWHFDLEPKGELDEAALLERAGEMRDRLRLPPQP